jgi:hypothetical protein
MHAPATNAWHRVQRHLKEQRSASSRREEKDAVAKKRSPKQKAATKKAQRASVRARKGGKRGKRRTKKRKARKTGSSVWEAQAKPRKRRTKKRKSAKRRRAAPRRRIKRRRAAKSISVPGTRVKIVKVPELKQIVIKKATPRRRKKSRRRKSLAENPMAIVPTFGLGDGLPGLLDNPAGPFSGAGLKQYGTAAAGDGFGLVVAGFVDRWVATRTPKDGKHPWYGRDAAAIINSRPDPMRLGAQAVGGVVSLGIAYYARGRTLIPFLFSGVALGFGAKLVSQVLDWYLMPALFKVDDWGKPTFGNRMYALEQDTVQKQLEAAIKSKSTSQLETDIPSAPGVQPVSPILSLGAQPQPTNGSTPQGKASAASDGNLGARALIPTGRVGMCASCNGMNGCYASCPDLVLCSECPGTSARRCSYPVKAGEDLYALVNAAGVDINQVSAMNEGGDPSVYWQPGNVVELPFALCTYLSQRDGGPSADYVPEAPSALMMSGLPETDLLGVGNEP